VKKWRGPLQEAVHDVSVADVPPVVSVDEMQAPLVYVDLSGQESSDMPVIQPTKVMESATRR
jgi:hypothetical protein